MVELNSERLNASYLNLLALRNTVTYVQKETYRRFDDNFLTTIGFPYVGEKVKDKKAFVGDKMDNMIQSIDELIVLGLVADFEKIVFDRVRNASGEIQKIVKRQYKSPPFLDFSTSFVKSINDIDKLSIIKSIVVEKLPEELYKKFAEVVEFRNRLAHGKRFGEQSLMSFDEISLVLDDVLNYI